MSFFNRRKLPVFLQDQIAECGLASAAMCLSYYGVDIDLPLLRQKYPVTSHGMNMHDIVTIFEHEGMVADVYELEMEHLTELPLPAILHWDLCHFVVLKKVSKTHCYYHDPALGEMRITLEEFSNHFTGYALTMNIAKPTEFDRVKSAWETLAKSGRLTLSELFKRSKGLGKGLAYLSFMTIVVQLLTMSIPLITQLIVDNFIIAGNSDYMIAILMGGAGLVLFRYLAEMLRGWALLFVGYRWHATFSSYFFQRLLKLPLSYFEQRSVADITLRFRVLDKLKDTLTTQVVQGVIDGIMSVVTLFAMFAYDVTLGFISLVFMVAYALVRTYFMQLEISGTRQHLMNKVLENHSFLESLNNVMSIKIFGRESARYQQWKKHYLKATNAEISLARSRLWYSAWDKLFDGGERLLLLWVAALAVINESMTLGMMFAFFAYREIFALQSKSLLNNIMSLKVLGVELGRLSDIEIAETEKNLLGQPGVTPDFKGKLEVKGITYRHPGEESPLFENLSFSVEAGENVVITGPSGCGKSTLVKILVGLLPVDRGEIFVDGIALEDIGIQAYRDHVAAVSQSEGLIAGSLLENICFFDKKADMGQIVGAAKKAYIHEDIVSMGMQYNTLVSGHHNHGLSGGQVQRVLLARAIYAKPTFLFMDEATSALDSVLEQSLVASLASLPMTRISVAHRQETIDMADREINLSLLQKV